MKPRWSKRIEKKTGKSVGQVLFKLMLVIAGLQRHTHEHRTSAASFSVCNALNLEKGEDQPGLKYYSLFTS